MSTPIRPIVSTSGTANVIVVLSGSCGAAVTTNPGRCTLLTQTRQYFVLTKCHPRRVPVAERTPADVVPDVPLDRTSPVPLYFQVATRLQQLIEDGGVPVGSRLENEIELAERLGVSRPTMRRAIQYL